MTPKQKINRSVAKLAIGLSEETANDLIQAMWGLDQHCMGFQGGLDLLPNQLERAEMMAAAFRKNSEFRKREDQFNRLIGPVLVKVAEGLLGHPDTIFDSERALKALITASPEIRNIAMEQLNVSLDGSVDLRGIPLVPLVRELATRKDRSTVLVLRDCLMEHCAPEFRSDITLSAVEQALVLRDFLRAGAHRLSEHQKILASRLEDIISQAERAANVV